MAWLALTWVMIFGGTPQSFWLVSRNVTILASLAANALNSGQTSSRDALRSLAALISGGALLDVLADRREGQADLLGFGWTRAAAAAEAAAGPAPG